MTVAGAQSQARLLSLSTRRHRVRLYSTRPSSTAEVAYVVQEIRELLRMTRPYGHTVRELEFGTRMEEPQSILRT